MSTPPRHRLWRYTLTALGVGVAAFLCAVGWLYLAWWGGPGPRAAARVVLEDHPAPRGMARAIGFGDEILPHLDDLTQSYTTLSPGRARRAADVLAGIASAESVAMLESLRGREVPLERVAGLYGLSAVAPETLNEEDVRFLEDCVAGSQAGCADGWAEVRVIARDALARATSSRRRPRPRVARVHPRRRLHAHRGAPGGARESAPAQGDSPS